MVFPAILVSKQLFKNSTNAWLLAVALSFQPMFNFLSAAPNNDIESNVISLLIISSTLSLLKKDSLKKTAIAGTYIGLGLVVKQLAIPVAISAAIVVILKLITSPARKMYKKLGLFIAVVLAISGWKYLPLFFQTGQIRYLPQTSTTSQVGNVQLHDYFLSALKKYYRESFVWYWGVYKWLGVTIPFWVVRLAKVIIIISGLGLVKTFISGPSKTKLQVSTLIFLSLFIVVFLTWWDYRLVLSTGIPYGIQGRYFFPTIGAHFGLITIGLTALTKRYKTQVLVIWAFLNMLFNLVFINKIIGSYYPADSLADLVRIASQYKPWFAKGNFLTTTASLHFIFQLVLLILLAKIFFTKNYEKK